MQNKEISILGCGWVGLPLAEFLIQKNFQVKGSTTKPEKLNVLREKGIDPFLIHFNPVLGATHWEAFMQSEVIVLNIPPQTRRKGQDFHIKQIESFLEKISSFFPKKVLYISSTSVYPNLNREVTEKDILDNRPETNKALLEAEQLLKKTNLDLTILRCGGLMGKNRIAGKYFAGKTIDTGKIPVNYVHLQDVIQVIYEVIKQDVWNETLNLVAPYHPTREEVYRKNAQDFDLELPKFAENSEISYKIVNSEKLIKRLNYSFIYPNPLEFDYQL